MRSTPAVWKQYNKMAVLHFFPVNSSLYILFSMPLTFKVYIKPIIFEGGGVKMSLTLLLHNSVYYDVIWKVLYFWKLKGWTNFNLNLLRCKKKCKNMAGVWSMKKKMICSHFNFKGFLLFAFIIAKNCLERQMPIYSLILNI